MFRNKITINFSKIRARTTDTITKLQSILFRMQMYERAFFSRFRFIIPNSDTGLQLKRIEH